MDWMREITTRVPPIDDSIYGPMYRCSLTLKDGTFLPCAVLQSRDRIVELAMRRFEEEKRGGGLFGKRNAYREIVSNFVANGNSVNDYDVASACESRFAIPLALLSQIHGETSMGWTGWVFRMRDGRAFSYGTSFSTEFFQLPEGYEFSDVVEVVNHSYLDVDGTVTSLKRASSLPTRYRPAAVLRERAFFSCAVDGL